MEAGRMIPLLGSDSSFRQAGQGSWELLLHSLHSEATGTVPLLPSEGRVAVLGYFPMVTPAPPPLLTASLLSQVAEGYEKLWRSSGVSSDGS